MGLVSALASCVPVLNGARLRDLMDRMGHDSARTALIYQHKSFAADQVIADALSVGIAALDQADSDGTDAR